MSSGLAPFEIRPVMPSVGTRDVPLWAVRGRVGRTYLRLDPPAGTAVWRSDRKRAKPITMTLPAAPPRSGLPELTRVAIATSSASDPMGLVGGTFRLLLLLGPNGQLISATAPLQDSAFDILWPDESLAVLPTVGVHLVRENYPTQAELSSRYPTAIPYSRLMTPRAIWIGSAVLALLVFGVVALLTF